MDKKVKLLTLALVCSLSFTTANLSYTLSLRPIEKIVEVPVEKIVYVDKIINNTEYVELPPIRVVQTKYVYVYPNVTREPILFEVFVYITARTPESQIGSGFWLRIKLNDTTIFVRSVHDEQQEVGFFANASDTINVWICNYDTQNCDAVLLFGLGNRVGNFTSPYMLPKTVIFNTRLIGARSNGYINMTYVAP